MSSTHTRADIYEKTDWFDMGGGGVKRPHHHIRITRQAKLDLEMWLTFLDTFNGISSMLDKQ